MRRSFHTLIVALALTLTPLIVRAEMTIDGPYSDVDRSITVSSAAFTTLALNASKTTDAIQTVGFRFITFSMVYVYNSATAVTMTCSHSETSGGTYKTIQVLSYSGATANSEPHVWSQAVSASENWSWRVNLHGYNYLKCTFSGTGAAVTDTLTVTAKLGTE